MKPAFFVLIGTLLPLADSTAACALSAVEQRDAELNRAISAHDVAVAGRYYTDAFVLTTSRGTRKTKATMLSEISSPAVQMDINETRDIAVFGDQQTAILTATLHQKGRVGDQPFDVSLLVTDTWICNAEDQWLLLAGHASKIST